VNNGVVVCGLLAALKIAWCWAQRLLTRLT